MNNETRRGRDLRANILDTRSAIRTLEGTKARFLKQIAEIDWRDVATEDQLLAMFILRHTSDIGLQEAKDKVEEYIGYNYP